MATIQEIYDQLWHRLEKIVKAFNDLQKLQLEVDNFDIILKQKVEKIMKEKDESCIS